MAKEDFCFTYYDGDAARDKAHMTRLCRGAYDDLISMQRKVGHMNLDTIKMVLSSDFDVCWASLKFILKVDEDGNYYIEWVDKSVKKMKENSEKNRKKIKEYWEKQKEVSNTLESKKDTVVSKNENKCNSLLVNENGNGNKEGGVGETKPIGSELVQKCARESWDDKLWLDNICMSKSLSESELQRWMASFNASVSNDSILNFNSNVYRKLFGGWLDVQRSKGRTLKQPERNFTPKTI